MVKLSTAIALLSAIAAVSVAHCPNGCSGHGKCGANDICTCHQNWQGADCSQRTCPFERAWVDTPERNNDAHYYAECANKGVCDRKTGMCKCFDGYEGKGCQRSTCPDNCSGHGTCEFINELAVESQDRRVGGVAGHSYGESNWDFQKIQGCKCDLGWDGASCADRICAHGDDPLTSISKNIHEKQRISLAVPSSEKYQGSSTVTDSTTATLTNDNPELALAADLTSTDDWKYTVGDYVHFSTDTRLFQVTAADADSVTFDQIPTISAGVGTVYRVKSKLTETVDTTGAATSLTKTVTLSGALAELEAGSIVSIDNIDYKIDSVSGADITLDKYVVVSGSGSATNDIYAKTLAAPDANDQYFVTYYDPYGGMWNTTALTITSSVTADAASLQSALRSLPNHVLDGVTVSGHSGDAGFYEDGSAKTAVKEAYEFIVTFPGSVGTSGSQHLFEVEARPTPAGAFPKSDGLFASKSQNIHGTSYAVATKEGVSGKTSADRSELAACSNRGICDGSSGQCQCFTGFRGLACEYQEALV